jgi:aromatic amino acid transport protein AroP
VVLTAALSVYNSCVYCNSRMLYGLAVQGDAPKQFLTVNRHGVPTLAIGVSALMTFLCVVVNYTIPERALELLMSLVVAALVINWAMISFAHLKFRAAKDRQGVTPHFKALFYPWANYLCLAFVVLILWIMTQIQGVAISVYVIPFWVGLMWVCYRVKNKQ